MEDRTTAWPAELTLVRHGESLGNVEALRADRAGELRLRLDTRDADTPLSDTGKTQAEAVGRWWADQPPGGRPDIVLTSPYRRARDTAQLAVASGGLGVEVRPDERLRERDLGAFDGLTRHGIRELFAGETERRRLSGKLYYRPPGGESWCDVALRVRSLVLTWQEEYAGRRLAVFTHQAVVMCTRMVLEDLDEATVLGADRDDPLANCAMTRYLDGPAGLALHAYNDQSAVDAGTSYAAR